MPEHEIPSEEAGDANKGAPELGATSDDELAYRLRQQELLSRFGLFALECASLEETTRYATEISARGLNVELCKFLVFKPEIERLLVVAGVGWKDGVIGQATLGADIASPAGYAFQTEQPVLSNHLASETRFRTPDLLLEHGVRRALNVPVKGNGGRTLGVLEVDSTNENKFTGADFAFLQGVANTLAAAIGLHRKNADLAEVLEREQLLAGELRHRVKNLFAVVSAMISLSQREAAEAGDPGRTVELLSSRIAALARASETGLRDHEVGSDGHGDFDPIEMTRLMLEPYGARTAVHGDELHLPGKMMTSLCLVLHELATNAVKYGALSTHRGTIDVTWSAASGGAGFVWAETGGPSVSSAPDEEGFGRQLIRRLLRGSGGHIEYDWQKNGLTASVVLA